MDNSEIVESLEYHIKCMYEDLESKQEEARIKSAECAILYSEIRSLQELVDEIKESISDE